jgi:hypothetical protein
MDFNVITNALISLNKAAMTRLVQTAINRDLPAGLEQIGD